jgi:hypothetical protein
VTAVSICMQNASLHASTCSMHAHSFQTLNALPALQVDGCISTGSPPLQPESCMPSMSQVSCLAAVCLTTFLGFLLPTLPFSLCHLSSLPFAEAVQGGRCLLRP